MMKQLFIGLLLFVLLISSVSAVTQYAVDNYDFRNIYEIWNVTRVTAQNITAVKFFGDGQGLTGITATAVASWDNTTGKPFNSTNSTQFSNGNGILTIVTSWITGLFNGYATTSYVDANLSQVRNAELNDNSTQAGLINQLFNANTTLTSNLNNLNTTVYNNNASQTTLANSKLNRTFADTLYYNKSNNQQFVNGTQVVLNVGNWSADKPSYNTTSQLHSIFVSPSSSIVCTYGVANITLTNSSVLVTCAAQQSGGGASVYLRNSTGGQQLTTEFNFSGSAVTSSFVDGNNISQIVLTGGGSGSGVNESLLNFTSSAAQFHVPIELDNNLGITQANSTGQQVCLINRNTADVTEICGSSPTNVLRIH